jgi:hypothetical protein
MIFSINWLFSRQRWRWLGLFGLLMLVGCGRSLDLKVTEKTLKEELLKQGVGSLKQVSCPQDMKAGQKFECIGIFESGIGFKIPVEHKNETDKLTWEIPTIKGMLNMNQVMKTIQSEIKVSEGSVDCGTSSTYRMATLGSRFECTVVLESLDAKAATDPKSDTKPDAKLGDLPTGKGVTKSVKEPDKIEIAIASSGDVTWQRMIAGVAPAGTTTKSKTSEAPSEMPAAAKKEDTKKSANGKAPAATPTEAEADVPYDS